MGKIDTQGWGEFRITDLFTVLKIKNKISAIDIEENGFIPVYSSTTDNNGVLGYTAKLPDYKISDDVPFYLIFGDHTKSMFIAKEDFCVMDNVKILQPTIFNENVVRFIMTSWYASIPSIGYARHWPLAKDSLFYLPITPSGDPDWKYMEQYMLNLKTAIDSSLNKLLSTLR